MQIDIGQSRLNQVFEYLKALNQHRNPTTRQVSEHVWVFWWKDLPKSPAIKVGFSLFGDNEASLDEDNSADYLLKVRRPQLSLPPPPPESILPWLESGWKDPLKDIKIKDNIEKIDDNKESILINFNDDPNRVETLNRWTERRAQWVETEIPARKTMDLFEHLYELFGRIQKQAEQFELVLGDGILNWYQQDGGINHPLILQRVQISFDPNVPEFTIEETNQHPELYSAIFHSIPDADPKFIAQCTEELTCGNFHPLGGKDTSGFLRRLVIQLSSKGEFIDEPVEGEKNYPRISRDPVIFLRRRTLGYTEAIESIIEDLQNQSAIPDSLLNIVGIETRKPYKSEDQLISEEFEHLLEKEDILLGKAANPEQIQIAQYLDRYPGVLVQGPPGTGKTHTIANLIGHLLAQGKNILVTSHTSKALRVLRQQVDESIRPLCVSILGNDSESQDQLKDSIENIVMRLSSSNKKKMMAEARRLKIRRSELIKQINSEKINLKEALANEYRDIVIAGQSFDPITAAKKVYAEKGVNDWIPLPIKSGAFPLSEEDLNFLYKTNKSFSFEDELEIQAGLPDPISIISPSEFQSRVTTLQNINRTHSKPDNTLWKEIGNNITADMISSLQAKIESALKQIDVEEPWQLAVLEAGMNGEITKRPWNTLFEKVDEVKAFADLTRESLLDNQPKIKGTEEIDSTLIQTILDHLSSGHTLKRFFLTIHPSWKKVYLAP